MSPAESLRPLLSGARWAAGVSWTSHPSLVAWLAATTVVRGLTPAGLAVAAKGLIDTAAAARSEGRGFEGLLPWLALGLGVTAVETVSRAAYQYLLRRFADEVDLSVTTRILEHAAGLEVAVFDEPRFQDVLHRAQQNTSVHFTRFVDEALTFATQLVQIVTLLVVLIAIEPLVVLALLPLAAVHLRWQWRLAGRHYDEEYARTTKRRWIRYFVALLTTRRTVAEIKLLDLAPLLADRFRALMAEIRDQNRGRYLSGFLGAVAIAVATSVAFYAVFARVLHGFLAGALTIGDVAIFGTVGLRLRGALETAVLSVSGALGQTLYISNLREFLGLESRPSGPSGRTPATTRGEIEYRGVSFTYPGADAPALVEVSLHIGAGETVALVGRNGAGKTTLVKLLGRFYEPDAGSVAFDGTDVRELAGDYLRRRIACVFQDPTPYEATAADNIAYGDWRRLLADRERVEQVARQAGVDRLIATLPRGYDTRLGRLFSEHDLSVGEWQQLAIARALARDASVLILDEPTASLDAVAEYELFRRFRDLARGRTTILISHRFSTVRMADRIIVLARGRVVESGSHEALLAGGGYYAELYAAHARQTARPLSETG